MKKPIVTSILLSFVFMPGIYAVLVPIVNSIVPPWGTKITYSFANIYFIVLFYVSFLFLIGCWLPYTLLVNHFSKNRFFRSYIGRSILLVPLQIFALSAASAMTGFFNQGNGVLKAMVYIVISSLLFAVLPPGLMLVVRKKTEEPT